MRTFSIYTLGCKVNQYEGAQIRQFLEGLGLAAVKPAEKPDLFVINTCCVTATASAKSRQYIQRAKKLNKSAKKVICGCLAALKTNELGTIENKSTCLVASRETLASKLSQIIGGARSGCSLTNSTNTSDTAQHSCIKPDNNQKINTFTGLTSLPKLPLLTSFKEHTRAFLKVQDGCDGVCSYCIIPKIRPEVQNKPIEDAVSEAKALVSAGHKEIVVTGVNLGAYGRQTVRRAGEQGSRGRENLELRIENEESRREELKNLLSELAQVPGLARIRVSSLEPGDISEALLDVFCKHPNIMPHIHLSVQSGSDNILRRMCRQYSADELREKITLIKSRLDRPAITCDIIVGFPGETEEDFQATVELAEWAGFSKMHVFGFSLREGTAAAKMKDRMQPKVVKERAEILRNLGDCLGRKFREQFIGETCEVLLEDTKPLSGRCERYFIVKVKSKSPFAKATADANEKVKSDCGLGSPVPGQSSSTRGRPCGSIVKVKITAVSSEGATA
jgi:threonylcarbamoyladenosine tRNA methylthiotransferase MtaB